jgi:ribonuclease HI
MANERYTDLIVYTDGGSRNNPGNAGIGFVIKANEATVLYEGSQYIGIKTNNEAEYTAMLTALTVVKEKYPECENVSLFSDSELMVRQLTGIYKIKEPGLKIIAEQIKSLLHTFASYKFTHVLRAYNKLADGLVNKALDAHVAK